ncbi:MAG: hypothetical protein AAF334_04385 [Pseudomonadota bacterium]
MTKLWSFENNGASGVRWADGNRPVHAGEGLCFGYSLIWCIKSQKFPDKPNLTKPDQFAAGLLQQRAETMFGAGGGDFDATVTSLVSKNGHSAEASISRTWSLLPRICALTGGHYIIQIGDHWIAYANAGGTCYFFDSNDGLYDFDHPTDFSQHVTTALRDNYKDDPDPDNGWSDMHMAFKITA